ncbi:FecCD family ABC transporter permease [Gracilibacillus marinus]|uniref:FecCD family ABC transporter permease n=1 Tax=Gracilibacillus marinus TaxID=630535 RepID=A0ABV8VYC3_9BACI
MTRNKFFIVKLLAFTILLLFVAVLALVLGAKDTSIKEVWLAITSTTTTDTITILREIRLPRIVGALLVGAALAVSGAIMQGVTRNPLADPGILGVSAGASVALALTMALLPSANYFVIMILCFLGASIGTFIVVGISSLSSTQFSPLKIVLAGSAVSAFLFAIADGVSIYYKISKDVSMWTAGGFIGANWSQLKIIGPAILVGIIIALFLARSLSLLSLNEDVAIGLGQNVVFMKLVLFLIISLLAGASVALAGNLAFVGLMIPHIVRSIVGQDYRYILPMSVIIGAIFMVFCEMLGRTLNAPYETSLTAIVSVLGLPFFLYIVRKGVKGL